MSNTLKCPLYASEADVSRVLAISGVELHGFLNFLIRCAFTGKHYTIFGYKGKQARSQIHSEDVVKVFESFIKSPKSDEVYNLDGGKKNTASVVECIHLFEEVSGKKLNYTLSTENRIGDHICYYSDLYKIKSDFPECDISINLKEIIKQINDAQIGNK
ncbi:MAG: hypothetical protein ABI844_04710 [Saprospiraceae bacterium]